MAVKSTARTTTTRRKAPAGGAGGGRTGGSARAATATRRSRAPKWVYRFEEGNASMRDLLGGKGAGVAEMTNAGLPVPPGFTITTEACNAYYAGGERFPEGMWEQALTALRGVEKVTGKGFGDARNPLLVSVRSGAKFSMPGMMDTVLNLGLNSVTLDGLAALTGNRRFALDSHRRFIQLFSKIVLGVDGQLFEEALGETKKHHGANLDAELSPEALEGLIDRYREIVRANASGDRGGEAFLATIGDARRTRSHGYVTYRLRDGIWTREATTSAQQPSDGFTVGAFEDDHEARRFAEAARAAGVPVNLVDKPAFCDFSFGSIVNRSPLVVGISTDGAAPVFAQAIRARIEEITTKSCAPARSAARSVQ